MKKNLQKINSLKINSVYKYGTLQPGRKNPNSDPTTTTLGTISTPTFKV